MKTSVIIMAGGIGERLWPGEIMAIKQRKKTKTIFKNN